MGKSSPRHTSVEFVAFLTDIVTNQLNDKEIHVIARGVFTSVSDLNRTLMRYIRHDNMQPKPVK